MIKGLLIMIVTFLACKNCVAAYTQNKYKGLFYLLMFSEIIASALIGVYW